MGSTNWSEIPTEDLEKMTAAIPRAIVIYRNLVRSATSPALSDLADRAAEDLSSTLNRVRAELTRRATQN